MHRSGTSLTTNWLGKCGLHLGFNLVGATPSNVKGHFEDLDILEFHEQLLRYNNTTFYTGTGTDLKYNAYHKAKAKSLIFLRDQLNNVWGWKQCRAVLFLGLWRSVSPEAKYFIVFRHPLEVVNSLYVRQLNKLRTSDNFAMRMIGVPSMIKERDEYFRRFFDMYCRYNMDILDHLNKINANDYYLIEVDDLVDASVGAIDHINGSWNIGLKNMDIQEIYSGSLHHKEHPEIKNNKYQQKALDVYHELKSKSTF
jgi:hypothetical protein